MRTTKLFSVALAFGLVVLGVTSGEAQQHRATRLGNPATRFADPLVKPADLRALFAGERLKADIISILQQSNWQGDLEDLRRAAAEAELVELRIPPGTRLPAMSSREKGRAVLLRDVLWAGREPIGAYAFVFSSKGRQYRVVTPKACSNFWIEDLGPNPMPVLAMACRAPAQVYVGRPLEVCLSVSNTGNAPESLITVELPLPAGVTVLDVKDGGHSQTNRVVWEIRNLAPRATNEVCAVLTALEPRDLAMKAAVRGAIAGPVESDCDSRVVGISALLLEVVDLTDPIEVGSEETYEIAVVNQGSAVGTQIGIRCTLEASQQYVSGTGPTPVRAEGRTITAEPLPALAPKEKAAWRITIKAVEAGDVRFRVELTSAQLDRAVQETEATRQY